MCKNHLCKSQMISKHFKTKAKILTGKIPFDHLGSQATWSSFEESFQFPSIESVS